MFIFFVLISSCASSRQLKVNNKVQYNIDSECGTVSITAYGIENGLTVEHYLKGDFGLDFISALSFYSSGKPAYPIKEISFSINGVSVNGSSQNQLQLNGSDTLKIYLKYDVPYFSLKQRVTFNPSNYIKCQGQNLGSEELNIIIGNLSTSS